MPKRLAFRTANLIGTIRRSLRQLGRNLDRLAAAAVDVEMAALRVATKPRRKLTISRARRTALKLQGQYMGYLRNLKPKQKAEVKAVREEKGIRAAIAAARRMGKAVRA